MDKRRLERIRALAGPVSVEQLEYVESHVAGGVGLFLPLGGHCKYSILPDHAHPSWMFTISYDGKTKVRIGSSIIDPPEGSLFALAPGVVHTELVSDEPPNYLAIFVEESFLLEQAGLFGKSPSLPESHTWVSADIKISRVARSVIAELDGKEPGHEAITRALSVQLVQLLLRNLSKLDGISPDNQDNTSLGRAAAYISANLHRTVTVTELARELGVSMPHLARIFIRDSGLSPSAFIMRMRLKAAKRMLLRSSKPLTEIAHECGFSSSSHFSRRFAMDIGEPPNRYRKRLGG